MTPEEKAILDAFEGIIEVHIIENGKDPWAEHTPQKSIACQYGGAQRMVHPEACAWHRRVKDPACRGCQRVGWKEEPRAKQKAQRQQNMFTGAL